jgi:hypothetical protein
VIAAAVGTALLGGGAFDAGFLPILSPGVPRVVSHVIVPNGTELLLTQTWIDGYYLRLNVKYKGCPWVQYFVANEQSIWLGDIQASPGSTKVRIKKYMFTFATFDVGNGELRLLDSDDVMRAPLLVDVDPYAYNFNRSADRNVELCKGASRD